MQWKIQTFHTVLFVKPTVGYKQTLCKGRMHITGKNATGLEKSGPQKQWNDMIKTSYAILIQGPFA